MDKAEYRIKLEQINSLAEAGDFKGAAAVVDTIDWRHVKSVRTLCMVGEIYEANKRYEDSKRVLQYAYKRSSISKTVLYRLAEINIRTGDYDDAKRFYNEFEQLSPHDTSRYILKYKLLRAEGATLDDQIAVLKEYKEREYTERWAYELAKLYMKNGQKQKCIEECDEMILWFAEGKYVTRAMELKMKLRALNDTQKKKYNDRYKTEEKETAEEARQEESMTAEERISKAADIAADEDEPLVEEKTEKKFSAVDIIRKMDAAADETVSSALGEERTGTVAAMAKVAQKAAATQEAVEKAAKATAAFPRGVAEIAETSAEQANAIPEEAVTEAAVEVAEEPAEKAAEEAKAVEKAIVEEVAVEPVEELVVEPAVEVTEKAEEVKAVEEAIVEEVAIEPVKEPAEEPVEAVKAAETIVEETAAQAVEEPVAEAKAAEAVAEESADLAGESVDHANIIAEQASADLAEAAAWKAAAIEESAAETSRKSAAIKAAEEKAAGEAAAARAKAAALAKQFKEQANAEAAEEAAWRAAMTEEAAAETVQEAIAIEDLTENDSEKTTAASGEVVDYVREFAVQANDEAAETAAWKAAAAANASGKSARKAAIEETEGAAMAVAAEEAAWIAATKAAVESINKSAGAAVETAEEIATTAVNEAAAETGAAAETTKEASVEEPDTPEEPAPISPEELARSADEEAERALQEMMASFLNEFAVSGDEYKKTTDIIPDEEDVPEKAPAPQPRENQNDPERMLGKETDESLGLTRTESFQEQLKKALEEGGNYEEASQIVIPDDLESPEDAAKRTVMTAHGLEYDPDGNASEEGEENTDAEDADSEVNADAESADAETPDTDSESNAGAEAADADSESNADAEGTDADSDSNADAEVTDANNEADADAKSAGAETTDDTATAGEGTDGDENGVTGENGEEPSAAEDGQESGEEAAESEEVPEPEPVKPEPEIMERVAVLPRKFTEEERELFSYFADIPGISEQASLALADIHNNAGDKTSRSGNVLIMGRQLSGKTRLADALICAACMDLNIKAAKVAKIIGEDLNDKDPAEVVDRMSGGFLLIEGAGSMSDEFVEGLNKAMEFRTDDLVVILEDEKGDLMNMLGKHAEFAGKFTSRIIIPVFTNDELVTFARTYANEKGYKLDEMGTLALYTMIGEHQTDNEPVVVGQVKKMVDKAIERSKGPKIAALFRKNTATEDGRTWLKEKDFRF